MTLSDIKDEIQKEVQANYRVVLKQAIDHFGMIAYLSGEVTTEEITKYAVDQYVKKLGNKIIVWTDQARVAGENDTN